MAIDKVRVISNIATAQTGVLLANQARKLGARVTLLVGPVGAISVAKGIRVLRFIFFDELFSIVKRELLNKKYDIVIHSAAVSDYQPKSAFKHKLKSGISNWGLELSPTLRIVDRIKEFSPHTLLVAFKLEFGLSKNQLIGEAQRLLKRANADLAVANTFEQNRYSASVIDRKGTVLARAYSKPKLAQRLLQTIKDKL